MRMRFSYLASLALLFPPLYVSAAACTNLSPGGSNSTPFWMGDRSLHAHGKSAFNAGFKVFRNVKDYGAVGDSVADDTAAINRAISDGGACGLGCPSSSVKPVLVYFPSGVYRVTGPIIPYYFTALVGDYNNRPTLLAAPNFAGIAIIDADPYIPGAQNPDGTGVNWWTNQNNFFRSVRNFVIDTSAMPATAFGTGIHWQVGQATSLINLAFFMSRVPGTAHQGMYMENGSGGFMSDLTFDGGALGMWVSNQQFTIRNVRISNAATAVYQWWNWGFVWQGISISNCGVGFDIHTGGLTLDQQSAGGLLIVDSDISDTGIGIRTSTSQPSSLAGSLMLDHVRFVRIATANIQDAAGPVMPAGDTAVAQWVMGNTYTGTGTRTYTRGPLPTPIPKAPALLDPSGNGRFFVRSRPQYNNYLPSQFLSVVSVGGAKGDGVTDDAPAINAFIAAHAGCGILYFDAGTYLVKSTIVIPAGTIIVGEMFSVILGAGSAFANANSPTPILRVGAKGERGIAELSDLVITAVGGSAGAVGVEWNIAQSGPGVAGMWDVHIRLGGTIGTNINAANCPITAQNTAACTSAFLGLHVSSFGSGYFENVWVWNADHDLDDPNQTQINSYSGRGVLIESAKGPVWLVGTASEHHVIYQYAFYNTENVYAGLIQTETPYFQPSPKSPAPFSIVPTYGDPPGTRDAALALVITASANVFIYGAGLYSFFQNYEQACVTSKNCQPSIALVDKSSSAVHILQLTTAGSVAMLSQTPGMPLITASDNTDGFASTATYWRSSSLDVPPPYTGSIPTKNCSAPPKVVGYYLGSAQTRGCLPWAPDAIDYTTYTHVIYGYTGLAANGTASLTTAQRTQIAGIVSLRQQEPNLKIMLGVGGWGFGSSDKANFLAMAPSATGRATFASTVAALVNDLGIDGVDIEWPYCTTGTCVSVEQFTSLVFTTKAALGRNLLVSVQLSLDFWSSADVSLGLPIIAASVEFISLITTYANSPKAHGEDANTISWIQESLDLAAAAAASVPSSMFLFGIPFFARPIPDNGTTTMLQSSCIEKGALGQGTYPYYAVDSLLQGDDAFDGIVYDRDAWTIYGTGLIWYENAFSLSDGSDMVAESKLSVALRAQTSQQLCMGGVSVYSIDQDTQLWDLANSIYSPGGFLPSTLAIYLQNRPAPAINGDGYVTTNSYNDFSNFVAAQYPFLSALDTYRLLLFNALDIQGQISNHLSSLLSAPELSADNFTIYKRWEGKAVDLAIANTTGLGNQFWKCTGDGTPFRCPGYIIVDDSIAAPSPHYSQYDVVEWTLVDHDGWKAFLNNTLGLNLDILTIGSFDVSRPIKTCSVQVPPPCKTGCNLVPNATPTSTSGQNSSLGHVLQKRDDPLIPNPACHTTWKGLYLIDTDTFFVNPNGIINSYIESTAQSVEAYTNVAQDEGVETTALLSLLQATLTAVSLGNQTIANTLVYINQTRQDEQEQALFEAESRFSVLDMILDIIFGLLAFIPGVGEVTDLILGGASAADQIADFVGIAEIANDFGKIGEDSSFARLFGNLRTDEAVGQAAASVEEHLSEGVLLTRGQFGRTIENVQGTILDCAVDLGDWVLDGADFGNALISPSISGAIHPSTGIVKEFTTQHRLPVNLSSIDESRRKRTGPPSACVWTAKTSNDLKISSDSYRALCSSGNLAMDVPNSLTAPTSTSSMTFQKCVAAHAGSCQCDHLYEATEFRSKLQQLSLAERASLCSLPFFATGSTDLIKNIINDPDNFAGIWGHRSINANTLKSTLLNKYQGKKGLKKAFTKFSKPGQDLMFDIVDKQLSVYQPNRERVGDRIDAQMHKWHAQVVAQGSAAQQASFKKLYTPNADGSQKSTYKALATQKASDARAMIAAVKPKPAASAQQPPLDSSDDDSDDSGKGKKKVATGAVKRSAQAQGCGTNTVKTSKRTKV